MGETVEGGGPELFLVEFLVDDVEIPSIRAMHSELLPSGTRVSFQIPNLAPVTINQDASSISNRNCLAERDIDPSGKKPLSRKGKSCLFALPEAIVDRTFDTFPIVMSVYKTLPPGVLPDVMLIGSRRIESKDLVNSLVGGNPSASTKETYVITTFTGQRVGRVTVFIRISRFGRKIVTQFQIAKEKRAYLFKGLEDGPIFQCKRIASIPSDGVANPDSVERSAIECNCRPTNRSSPARSSMRRLT